MTEQEQKELEKIPLMFVYKYRGQIHVDTPENKRDLDDFEMLGFLRYYTMLIEHNLVKAYEDATRGTEKT